MAREMKDSGVDWVGMIPTTWEMRKGKYLFLLRNQRGNKFELQLLSPTQKFGVIPQALYEELTGMSAVKLDEKVDLASLKTIHKGDYCISLRSYQGGFEYSQYEGVVSPAYQVFYPTVEIADGYYKYLFKDRTFIKKMGSYTMTLRDGKNISFSDFGDTYIPYPTISEQIKIANFLDAKCAELDNILVQTRASIEEYKKLKQAFITQAVTKGVRGDREMKGSRIEWIREIPSEWKEQRIKTLFYLRDEKNYLPLEEVNLISLYTDLGVVQHSELEKTTGNKASNADGYKIVCENDIVVNIILCWMGAVGRSAYNGVTSPAYDIYIPRSGVDSKFYHYYFRTKGFGGDCYKRGKGIMAMRWRTYSEQFRDINVVYPPLEEQHEIVKYLDAKCSEIDNLIIKKEKYLAEIENYRKSLVYEYVTGKKEVLQEYKE